MNRDDILRWALTQQPPSDEDRDTPAHEVDEMLDMVADIHLSNDQVDSAATGPPPIPLRPTQTEAHANIEAATLNAAEPRQRDFRMLDVVNNWNLGRPLGRVPQFGELPIRWDSFEQSSTGIDRQIDDNSQLVPLQDSTSGGDSGPSRDKGKRKAQEPSSNVNPEAPVFIPGASNRLQTSGMGEGNIALMPSSQQPTMRPTSNFQTNNGPTSSNRNEGVQYYNVCSAPDIGTSRQYVTTGDQAYGEHLVIQPAQGARQSDLISNRQRHLTIPTGMKPRIRQSGGSTAAPPPTRLPGQQAGPLIPWQQPGSSAPIAVQPQLESSGRIQVAQPAVGQTDEQAGPLVLWQQPRSFAPTTMRQQALTGIPQRPPPPPGVKYLGDINSFSYTRQETGLSDDENCCLFIKNIEATVTIQEIFDTIHCGGVVALYVSPPSPPRYTTQGAKLLFKTHKAALEYFQLSINPGISFRGLPITIVWNKHGVREHPLPFQSRIVLISCPTNMDLDIWLRYFDMYCEYQLDRYAMYPHDAGVGKWTLMFSFARIDGQAQTILTAICNDRALKDVVTAEYGPDPCDPYDRARFQTDMNAYTPQQIQQAQLQLMQQPHEQPDN